MLTASWRSSATWDRLRDALKSTEKWWVVVMLNSNSRRTRSISFLTAGAGGARRRRHEQGQLGGDRAVPGGGLAWPRGRAVQAGRAPQGLGPRCTGRVPPAAAQHPRLPPWWPARGPETCPPRPCATPSLRRPRCASQSLRRGPRPGDLPTSPGPSRSGIILMLTELLIF